MNGPSIKTMRRNARLIGDILSTNDRKKINSSLDKMINTVNIFYESKKDFIDNFPEEDDMASKAKLIIRRRR